MRKRELDRIERDYDQSTSWTENDEHEKRTTPVEFKKPLPPVMEPVSTQASTQQQQSTSTNNTAARLLTQIAQMKKIEETKIHQRTQQCSTPATVKLPTFIDKLSPIDKVGPATRVNTQMLFTIQENDSPDDQSQVKRRKLEHDEPECNAKNEDDNNNKEEVYLSTVDDIKDEDLEF